MGLSFLRRSKAADAPAQIDDVIAKRLAQEYQRSLVTPVFPVTPHMDDPARARVQWSREQIVAALGSSAR